MKYAVCYLSEIGHKNFLYPSETTVLIPFPSECEYHVLPWLGGKEKNLTPIRISKSCIIPLRDVDMSTVQSQRDDLVVWVRDEFLPLSSVGRANDC